MEHLFSLVFDNLWLLIIIFGILSSLLGGDKKKKGKEHRPQLDIPSMRTEKHREPKREVQPVEVSMPVPEAQDEPTIANEQLRYMQERLARQAAEVEKKVAAIQKGGTASKQQGGIRSPYSKKSELVNGIVMAEILGPPRAKKPLHRGK